MKPEMKIDEDLEQVSSDIKIRDKMFGEYLKGARSEEVFRFGGKKHIHKYMCRLYYM